MIPKIIHYCWFGGNPLPEDAKRCIASWRRYMPDYEIKEWNESNFDIRCNTYCEQAYNAKKYAFVSDYARLWILYQEGGIYFDTDVEVIKPLDDIIAKGAFMGCETSPTKDNQIITVNPGLGLGVEPKHPVYKELLDLYDKRSFILNDGSMDLKTIVTTTTEVLFEHGLQISNEIQQIDGISIYPKDFFCPIGIDGKMEMTERTHTIHHYAQSWMPASHIWLRKMILSLGGWRLKRLVSKLYNVIKRH